MRRSNKTQANRTEGGRAKLSQRYWWLLAQGVCALAFGFLAIFWSNRAIFLFLYAFGAYAVVDGLIPLGHAIFGGKQAQTRSRQTLFLEGAISVVCGLLVLLLPRTNNWLLFYVIAAWLVLKGVSLLMQMRARGWITSLIGIVALLMGLYLFINPVNGFHNLFRLLGFFALFMGVLLIVRGWRARSARKAVGRVEPAG